MVMTGHHVHGSVSVIPFQVTISTRPSSEVDEIAKEVQMAMLCEKTRGFYRGPILSMVIKGIPKN